MHFRRLLFLIAIVCLLGGLVLWAPFCAPPVRAQTSAPPADTGTVIRAETRLVLVDTIVTDKKGAYVRDLERKDFRVWEDNKEQVLKSFSIENDEASPNNPQKRYLVLFFDNASMDVSDQMRARQAATQFIERNAAPNRLMAIMDYGGAVHIAQNFTADAERLKKVVADVKFSYTSPNQPVEVASLGLPPLSNAEAEFGMRSVLLALRSVAKSLLTTPGRKTVLFLSAGFSLTPEVQSELTATIDSCNKSNVAVYPVDVRGLIAPTASDPRAPVPKTMPRSPRVTSAALRYDEASPLGNAHLVYVQHGGGGGGGHSGGGGGTGGGGHVGGTGGGGHGGTGTTGGARGTTTGAPRPSPLAYNPALAQQARDIVPSFPPSASDNQRVLYELAEGTGGFVIINSNDLLGGMERIAHDQGQYYSLGYTPPESPEGSCHTLKVKVDRGGTIVRARSGYCNTKPVDLLAGKTEGKELESRVQGSQSGNLQATVAAPFFYTAPNTARVNLALDIPTDKIKFEKEKGKQHAALNVLGIAYKPDGSVAARFSDTVNLDFEDKKEVEEFRKQPFEYENQFDIASGQYTLKVAFSSGGEGFGKVEAPLAIDAYDAQQFSLSAMALSKNLHRVADLATGLDAALLEDRTPLVAQGMEMQPTAETRFKQNQPAAIYVEIYEPALLATATPPKVQLMLDFVDRKTGQAKISAAFDRTESAMHPGNPVIPVGVRIPCEKLGPGSYRVEMKAVDSAGHSSKPRAADFDVE